MAGTTKPACQRWLWLIVIWIASVAALGSVSWLFRLLMHAAGLQS
ncbi:DUF2474 domain-containing protein [Salinivibrio kushneri]|uniref:DUF2474 domain-containing protein n=1 Tax=Salinivibrio kushneri TaxID=1908198 RepID=A0AA47LRT2_9GAMM|nr:DUF2474 domain-containing protein [Salinivibrio kushneri]WBA09618.1 DUF2474 domain-containing protein [Salinivibrio kushneri]